MRPVPEAIQTGSLSGAEQPLQDNADVQKLVPSGQKPLIEYTGKNLPKAEGCEHPRNVKAWLRDPL